MRREPSGNGGARWSSTRNMPTRTTGWATRSMRKGGRRRPWRTGATVSNCNPMTQPHCGARAIPKAEPAIANGIAYHIHRNLHQPGTEAGLATKPVTRLVGFQETILRQGFGGIPVSQTSQGEAKDFGPIEPHNGVEVLDLSRLVHCVRDPLGCRNRLHL